MIRTASLVTIVVLVACGRGGSGDASSPTDTLTAALEAYEAKRISADSAAAIIAGYQQRTGRAVNIEMDAELLAALQRREQRRVP